LDIVGLADRAKAYPAQLSGGQQQRVAIARALATDPKILLCDEATSALDPKTTTSILDLIRDINKKMGITVLVITHQMSVVEDICRHVAIIDEGEVVEQGDVSEVFSHPKSEAARRLVFPEGDASAELVQGAFNRIIRVVYNGSESAEEPVIASLAMEKGIAASILYASTKSMDEKAYGTMLLGLNGGDDMVRETIDYLQQNDSVTAEEVQHHVG